MMKQIKIIKIKKIILYESWTIFNIRNNNNNDLQLDIEKEVSKVIIDESIIPMKNASNKIYNEIQHWKGNNNSKKSNFYQEWKEEKIMIFQMIYMIRIKT